MSSYQTPCDRTDIDRFLHNKNTFMLQGMSPLTAELPTRELIRPDTSALRDSCSSKLWLDARSVTLIGKILSRTVTEGGVRFIFILFSFQCLKELDSCGHAVSLSKYNRKKAILDSHSNLDSLAACSAHLYHKVESNEGSHGDRACLVTTSSGTIVEAHALQVQVFLVMCGP